MLASHLLVIAILIGGAAAAVFRRKLTPAAGLTGVLVGAAIYTGSGLPGLCLLALFFILGTTATSWDKEKKRNIKGSAAHESIRTPGQVFANAGVAAILGLLTLIIPHHYALFLLLMAATFSSATADTLSSELGMVYGHRFFNILTLKPDQRGLDGVISLEGTFIGIAGSAIIAAAFAITTHLNLRNSGIIVLAGTIGNLADSALGALFERKGKLGNNAVNFLNTLIAALFALTLS